MKKIIAIVLMLCLMIPTCFADWSDYSTRNFKDEVLYRIDNLAKDNKKDDLSYIYLESMSYDDNIDLVTLMYFSSDDSTYLVISDSNMKTTYIYAVNNLFCMYNALGAISSTLGFYFAFTDLEPKTFLIIFSNDIIGSTVEKENGITKVYTNVNYAAENSYLTKYASKSTLTRMINDMYK